MNYLAKRLLRGLFTLWLVVSIIFLLFRLLGDPLNVLLPESTPPDLRAYYADKWGLSAPIPEQYLRYFVSIVQGDLGYSFTSGRKVADIVGEELPNTLLLGSAAYLLALTLGIGLGTIAAKHHNQPLDRLMMLLTIAGFSLPNYFLGTVLIIVFAVNLHWLPTSGNDSWQHLVLPVVTLGTASAARIGRFTRNSLLEVMYEPHLQTARAKGLSERRILYAHVFRNAAIPVITVIGPQLGYLVGGSVIIESVFGYPGIGRLMVEAVSIRDLALVQALVLLIAASVILFNFLTDVAYGLFDPQNSPRGLIHDPTCPTHSDYEASASGRGSVADSAVHDFAGNVRSVSGSGAIRSIRYPECHAAARRQFRTSAGNGFSWARCFQPSVVIHSRDFADQRRWHGHFRRRWGAPSASLAGDRRGIFEDIVMTAVDVQASLPFIVFALTALALLGNSVRLAAAGHRHQWLGELCSPRAGDGSVCKGTRIRLGGEVAWHPTACRLSASHSAEHRQPAGRRIRFQPGRHHPAGVELELPGPGRAASNDQSRANDG
ncbi:MAG: ABC transporter permease [Chloroflexi bacterium]|nr:ABC transporter permease [Chloroflexota bacterium]